MISLITVQHPTAQIISEETGYLLLQVPCQPVYQQSQLKGASAQPLIVWMNPPLEVRHLISFSQGTKRLYGRHNQICILSLNELK
jgi:hypothetical protein